ncbi:hypothetical protein IFM89_027558 [Coptis chinensis]|uniref:Uncharacterized protein n=1 Tax=Coptis chinensis TaxID=261450 RepID=A0A835HN06_9MAGN|nr:hypothetical protein IFM89_027558 [Coptis chinensis]
MADHLAADDLDQLLDSALDDFSNLNLTSSSSSTQRVKDNEEAKVGSKACLPTGVQGLGGGLPDLRSKKKGKQKALKENHVTEALEKLREQTRETVRGLESTAYKPKAGGGDDDLGKEGMMEDWVKQFEELAGSQVTLIEKWVVKKCLSGLRKRWTIATAVFSQEDDKEATFQQVLNETVQSSKGSDVNKNVDEEEEAHSLGYSHCQLTTLYKILEDMESIVETMMQQLLSKEILHEPMKEIGQRYPKWLEEHKSGLSKEEYDRYSHQYELIKNLNEVYENDPGNYSKIVDLMQKMQECGQPPNDIVKELAPDLDLTNLAQL